MDQPVPTPRPELSVIVVSHNTRDMTLTALRSLIAQTRDTSMRIVVFDNASRDGSASAIAEAFPDVHLIRSAQNLGFARANNIAARQVTTDWVLLLNPDTEVQDRAVDHLLAFARAHPDHGIYGGRTVFGDGRLNPGSCWMRITVWSSLCLALGLTAAFRNSALFNPEGMGNWPRDTVRAVDIVQGSFLLIRRSLWADLGGFAERYFMYGEEADLCLRAIAKGYRPVITPQAQIVHHSGAASGSRGGRQVLLAQGRATLIRDHWARWKQPVGLSFMVLGAALRALGYRLAAWIRPRRFAGRAMAAAQVWHARKVWIRGY